MHLPQAERRQRILIADDETVIADTLRAIMRLEGFEVIAVYGGVAAVEKAREWRPDLFLSDVMMPDMNGFDAAIRIQSLAPACRILLISGKAMAEDLKEDAEQRGYDFELLAKPVHPTELIQVVRLMLQI